MASDGASAFMRGSQKCGKDRRAHGLRLGRRAGGEVLAVPQPGGVVAVAVVRREPQAVHAHRAQLAVVGIVDGDVAHGSAIAVAERRDAGLELRQRVGRLTVEGHDHRAARDAGRAEHVAGIGDVHPAGRDVEVPRLLIGQRIHHRIAELGIGARGDGVQVADRQLRGHRLATALQLHLHRLADRAIEHLLERLELRDVVTVEAHQDVPGLQHVLAAAAGQHLGHHQHAGEARKVLAHRGLGVGASSPRRSSSSYGM